jgi:hypothetical protein
MSLNTVQFKTDLKALYTNAQTGTDDADAALDSFLDAFVLAAENFIKSAQIVYTGGLAADGVPVAGTFEGEIE